jgi:hypothetical protein
MPLHGDKATKLTTLPNGGFSLERGYHDTEIEPTSKGGCQTTA